MRFVFDYSNVVASRSRVIDFVGSALIDCMAKHAPHSLVRGEYEVDSGQEGDEEDRLLAMLRLAVQEAAEGCGLEGVADVVSSDSETE